LRNEWKGRVSRALCVAQQELKEQEIAKMLEASSSQVGETVT
jgi:hypothetical protein